MLLHTPCNSYKDAPAQAALHYRLLVNGTCCRSIHRARQRQTVIAYIVQASHCIAAVALRVCVRHCVPRAAFAAVDDSCRWRLLRRQLGSRKSQSWLHLTLPRATLCAHLAPAHNLNPDISRHCARHCALRPVALQCCISMPECQRRGSHGTYPHDGAICRGWQRVSVDDQFFAGLAEPGFQELEELSNGNAGLLGEDLQALIAKADAALASGAVDAPQPASGGAHAKAGQSKQSRKRKRRREEAAAASVQAPDAANSASGVKDVQTDLLARIQKLETENATLRNPHGEAHTGSAGAATEAKSARKRTIRSAEYEGNSAAEAAAPPQAAKQHAEAVQDLSAWDDYGLDQLVIDSLGQQGFTAPTPIQHECLPAAVRGGADIIGAAQTVRLQTYGYTTDMSRTACCMHIGLQNSLDLSLCNVLHISAIAQGRTWWCRAQARHLHLVFPC